MEIGLVIFASALAVSVPTGQNEIFRAYYKQSGMEKSVKRIEKEQLSQETRTMLANAALLTRMVVEQRIEFRWTFP